MKKIFTLLTLLVAMATGAWADAETIFDAADWSEKTVTDGSVSVGDVTWYGSNPDVTSSSKTFSDDVSWTAYLKTGGGSTLNSTTKTRVLAYTPTTAGTIKVYARGGGKSSRYVYITQTASTDDSDQLGSGQGGDGTSQLDCIASAEVDANTTVYIWGSGNMLIYGITFESSTPTTKTTVNAAQNGAIAYLDNSGTITGSKTEPYVAYTLSYNNYPMTIQCSTADNGENIQAGNDQYQFTIDANNYTGAKFSKKTYVIVPNDGVTITAVSAYASSNSNSASTISTYGGTSLDVAVRGEKNTPASPTAFPLAKNASNYYEFTIDGSASQALVVLKVTYNISENVDVKVSAAGYATLYYGSKLTIPDGVTAYSATVSGETITLTEIADVIPANTGVILEAAAGTYNFSVTTADAPAVGSNILSGTTTATTVTALGGTVYTLGQNGEGVVGLRNYTGEDIRAYSAYATSISSARDFYEFDINGFSTGIKNMKVATEDNVYYNLQGQRVLYPTKGLYIVNGKKVIVK